MKSSPPIIRYSLAPTYDVLFGVHSGFGISLGALRQSKELQGLAVFWQLQQSYLNNYFQAKVGKELPKHFPEPLLVGNLDIGNFAFSSTANTLQSRNYLECFQGGSESVFDCLINC